MVKNPPAIAGDAGDAGSIPGLRRVPGEGNGNPLQYSCLGNPMDRGAWGTIVHEKKQEVVPDSSITYERKEFSEPRGL